MIPQILNVIRQRRAANIEQKKLKKFFNSGSLPWTEGYKQYKEASLQEVIHNESLLELFRSNSLLPENYGFRIDERIVEYPWVISRISEDRQLVLDAGSTLNRRTILDLPVFRNKQLLIYNLAPGKIFKQKNVSYINGDLRDTIIKSDCVDEIVCISTLEHIGMDNTMLYTKDSHFDESNPSDYQKVLKEFKRVLKPGGKLFITVPFGRSENHGWLQQFDKNGVDTILDVFKGTDANVIFYKYFKNGWQTVDATKCTDAKYFDVHKSKQKYEDDFVAAARAVACLELIK